MSTPVNGADSRALLVMWNDVEPSREAAYEQWHSEVHLPERMAIPGFRRGRRYSRPDAQRQKYFVAYDIEGMDVLASDDYLRLVNEVAPETEDMMVTAFRDFTRGACEVVYRGGTGVLGGAVRIWRFDAADTVRNVTPASLKEEAVRLLSRSGVTAVTAAVASTPAVALPNAERVVRERRAPDGVFTSLLMVETRDHAQASALTLSPAFDAAYGAAGPGAFSESYFLNVALPGPRRAAAPR